MCQTKVIAIAQKVGLKRDAYPTSVAPIKLFWGAPGYIPVWAHKICLYFTFISVLKK